MIWTHSLLIIIARHKYYAIETLTRDQIWKFKIGFGQAPLFPVEVKYFSQLDEFTDRKMNQMNQNHYPESGGIVVKANQPFWAESSLLWNNCAAIVMACARSSTATSLSAWLASEGANCTYLVSEA